MFVIFMDDKNISGQRYDYDVRQASFAAYQCSAGPTAATLSVT